jgi:hypothetical protein
MWTVGGAGDGSAWGSNPVQLEPKPHFWHHDDRRGSLPTLIKLATDPEYKDVEVDAPYAHEPVSVVGVGPIRAEGLTVRRGETDSY